MHSISPLHILLLLLLAIPANAADILIVQSARVKAYDEVARGFRGVVERKAEQVSLADLDGEDLAGVVREVRPRVILAVGLDAFLEARKIRRIPVVYAMVLNPEARIGDDDNATGVGMKVPPERQLSLLKQALPSAKRIGLLYDPAKSGNLVRRALGFAEELGLVLVAREVRRSRDVPPLVDGMKGVVNAFLLLPDPTVVTPQTLEFIPQLSVSSRIPVVAFSEQYLKHGALLAIGIDPVDIGRQAGELANRILAGENARNIDPAEPRRAVLHINAKAAKQLGIAVNHPAGADVVVHR